MTEATTVWLVRHGSPENTDGRCYGRHDAALSPEGIEQAQRAAQQLASEPILHIYSSTLRRALETARIVAEPRGLSVQTVRELEEIDFGDFEGLTYEEIQERSPDVFESWMTNPTQTQFPNGENFQQMSRRVLAALDALLSRHRNESIAIIAHAGVIRVALSAALSIPDTAIFRLAQHYGALNRIRYFENGPVVELING